MESLILNVALANLWLNHAIQNPIALMVSELGKVQVGFFRPCGDGQFRISPLLHLGLIRLLDGDIDRGSSWAR